MGNERIFTVTEVNNYIKNIFQKDMLLSHIYVKGELSNLKLHSSGHIYFTLKDSESRVKGVMFRGSAAKLKFIPEDGLAVIVRGYFSLYERDGQYQLYAEDMVPEGTGSLYKAYEQLKKRLSEEGLFDPAKKKNLPFMPGTVGVVTSPTGAAVRDILSIIKRRCPSTNIILYPVQVQGEGACNEIAEGIRYFNSRKLVDVMIVGRGGGSIEELWAFNEEVVARAIYESEIPVISAVGHETDYTIADFAADLRAATPSAAAELVVPDRQSLIARVNRQKYMLDSLVVKYISNKRQRIEKISNENVFRQLERKLLNFRQTLDMLSKYLDYNISYILKNKKAELAKNIEKLEILNPESALERGYAIVRKAKDGRLVSSIRDVEASDELELKLRDGSIVAKVIK